MSGNVIRLDEVLARTRTPTIVTDHQFNAGVEELSEFIHTRVERISREVGFGYRPSATAPTTFKALLAEHKVSGLTGLPLRVSSDHCETSIFTPEDNWRYRFWHDGTHVATGGNFSRAGEAVVAQEQLRQLEQAGTTPDSLVWRLLFCETFGQAECVHRLGSYPVDQCQFTKDYLAFGLLAAIELEGRRQHQGELQLYLSNVVMLRLRPQATGTTTGDAA